MIPYFSDSKRQTAHHPLAELIRSSLESISTWQYEPLFELLRLISSMINICKRLKISKKIQMK